MAPPRHPARPDRRPKRPSLFLAREDLEIRVVPALIGAAPIAPAVPIPSSSISPVVTITPDGGSGSPQGYTPQQIRMAYGVDNIAFGSIVGDGTGQTIAIVDAYDDPGLVDSTASNFSTSDLAEFDSTFNLPNPPSFTKVNEYGSTSNLPGTDPAGAGSTSGNWEYEEAMDVEWAHALAPGANIVLVEANSSAFGDLYQGITKAADLPGVSTVSLSWGSSEFSGESYWDTDFQTPAGHQGVTFVAATGDGGSPGIYPAYSPDVVAAGGTSLSLNPDNFYQSESAWSSSGGGVSSQESEPAYQDGVQSTGQRTIPDVSFVADRSPGVAVYDSYDNTGGGPWTNMGGTSLAAPAWAALIAVADQGRVAEGGTTLDGATQTLPALYALPAADFHDVTSGSNGTDSAGPGYDEVTGLGTPVANLLVPDLAFYGMADHLAITAQPTSSAAGSPFGLTVEIESPDGSLVTDAAGSLTIALGNDPGGASLGGALTATIDQGVATFSGLAINQAGTGYTLTVSRDGLGSASSSAFKVTPGSASAFVIAAQPPSSLVAGTTFGLTVDVEDAYGNLVTGFGSEVTVGLLGGPGGASLGGTADARASGGVATFTGLTIDQAGAGYSLQAVASGLTAAQTPTFAVTPAAPSKLVVATEPPSGITAGSGFGLSLDVEDAYGNLVTGYGSEVMLGLSGGSSLGGTVVATASGGVASFSGLTIDQNGAYTIQVSAAGLAAATTTAFYVMPAAPSGLVITAAPPSSVTAGAGFALSVSVEDAYGNLESGFFGDVTVGLSGGPSGAVLGGPISQQAIGGVAAFSGLDLTKAGSGYTISASVAGLTSAQSGGLAVTPAAPSMLVITTPPAYSLTAGRPFGLSVSVEDPFGNLEPNFDGDVTLNLSGETANARLDGTLTAAASGGVATFSGLAINEAGSGYAIAASGSGLTPANSEALDVTPAAPAYLVITTRTPASITAGAPFGLRVAVEDAFGNIETSFVGRVALDLTGRPTGAALGGSASVDASSGIATFSGLILDQAGTRYVLQASGSGLVSADTGDLAVSPAAPARLVIGTQPSASVTAGHAFGLGVTVDDAFGNVVTDDSGTASISLSGGTLGASLAGQTTVAVEQGSGTFSGLTLDKAAAGYTLQVDAAGLGAATTMPFQVAPSVPSQLVIVAQPPSGVVAGQTFGFAVATEDQFGNVETTFNGPVSATLVDGPPGGSLSGDLTATASNGTATFSGLTLDSAGGGYSLAASTGGLTSTGTTAVAVTPAPATRLVIVAQPSGSVVRKQPFAVGVEALDAFGNVATSFDGTVNAALTSHPNRNKLAGLVSVQASGGQALIDGTTLEKTGKSYAITITSSGLTPTATSVFNVSKPSATDRATVRRESKLHVHGPGKPFAHFHGGPHRGREIRPDAHHKRKR